MVSIKLMQIFGCGGGVQVNPFITNALPDTLDSQTNTAATDDRYSHGAAPRDTH